MSAGKKFAWGCGILLLLIVAAGGGGLCYLVHEFGFTRDAAKIAERTQSILPLDVPPDLRPFVSLYTDEDQSDPMALYASDRRGEALSLVLLAHRDPLTISEGFNRMHNAHPGMDRVDVQFSERAEDVPVQFLGDTVVAKMDEREEEGVTVRLLIVVLEYGGRNVLLSLEGDPERVTPEFLQSLLDSVQRNVRDGG